MTTTHIPTKRQGSPAMLGALAIALACVVTVHGCSKSPRSSSTAAVASAEAPDLRLVPDPAFGESRIDAVLDHRRIDPERCRYRWMRNGIEIRGEESAHLDPSHFSRGDEIRLRVEFADRGGREAQELSAKVRVVNTPPRVRSAVLAMVATESAADVRVAVETVDADRDEVAHEYRWFRNGEPLVGASGPSVSSGSFARGDRLEVEVVASDAEASSPPVRSEPFTIDNLPPRFTSQPLALRPSDDTFRYRVTADDPDRDALVFELVRAPSGMTLEPGHVVVWRLPPRDERRGEHVVSVKVSDRKGGEAVQEFTLRLGPDGTRR